MADVFEWGAIRVFLGSGVIEYLVPVGKVCIRVDLCQTFIGRNDKIIWNDNRVGFCVCKPDRQIFELQDVFIGDKCIRQSLADRICGSVAGRVENDLFHGHKAAVGAAADVNAGAVDLRMGIHESTDQGIENFGIFGRTVFGIFAGSVIHPHGRSLRSEQVGLAAENFLNLWGNQVYNFISDCCDRRLLSALTCAVQPDDQRDFLIRIHFRLVVNVRERNLRILVAVFFEPFTVDDAVSTVYVEHLRRNGTIVCCNFRDLCHIVSDFDKYIKITIEFDDRADSFHDKTRQLQRQAGAVLARCTGFVRNVNVRNAAGSVHRVIRFVAHKIRPDKVLTLGGSAGNVYRKLLRRWDRTLHAFAIIQNYFRNMRTEIKNFGNGIISSVHL